MTLLRSLAYLWMGASILSSQLGALSPELEEASRQSLARYEKEKEAYAALKKRGGELSKKYGLELLNACLGKLLLNDKDCVYCLHLKGRGCFTLEQLRPMAEGLRTSLIAEIFARPVYKESFIGLRQTKGSPPPQFSEDQTGFRLSFWDENMDRPKPPYVAEIRMRGSELLFYYADPVSQVLVDYIEI